MTHFMKVLLFTDANGAAKFRDETVELSEGTPAALLSPLLASGGYQLRHSPPGFASEFHCTSMPQWVVILGGIMEIELHDGSTRRFRAGDHFFSADTVPKNAAFDPLRHGHRSRQIGSEPLITLFVRA